VECPQYSIRLEALSAMCALAVYVAHSSQRKIQDLVSRDSLVDRPFVTNSAQLEGTLYHSPQITSGSVQ